MEKSGQTELIQRSTDSVAGLSQFEAVLAAPNKPENCGKFLQEIRRQENKLKNGNFSVENSRIWGNF